MQPETRAKGNPMTTPNPENDEDLEISEKIEESRCIEQLGYDRFIRLCIQFTREAVLHHNTQTPAAADIRRLTLTFLYPKLLHGIEEAGQPDSHDFLFLNLLWDINPSLCHQFWNYLTAHIEAA